MADNIFILIKKDGTTIEFPEIEGLQVEFVGRNNKVIIEEGAFFHNCKFHLNSKCEIKIARTQPRGLKNTVINMLGSSNSMFEMQEDTSIESALIMMTNENNCSVSIGKDCLLSSNIVFRANDGHTIYDINTKKILNYPEPIIIGDHVWLGAGVTILKGACIPNNSVVGIGSLVTKQFDEECVVIGGAPAKIIKNGINWDRRHIKDFE